MMMIEFNDAYEKAIKRVIYYNSRKRLSLSLTTHTLGLGKIKKGDETRNDRTTCTKQGTKRVYERERKTVG